MDDILFVDACVRAESRTRRLAEAALAALGGRVERVALGETPSAPLDAASLQARTALLEQGKLGAPMLECARRFAAADRIVIAAPYWDLAFPACLKAYLEQVTVCGVTFRYDEQGVPRGLCRARRLYYIATAGGPIYGENLGYAYVAALARGLYGIAETRYFDAQGLDIDGADVPALLADAERRIAAALSSD